METPIEERLTPALEKMIAKDDTVGFRPSVSETHDGHLMWIEPTGDEVSTTSIFIYRIGDGRIAESWLHYDGPNLLGQLGAR